MSRSDQIPDSSAPSHSESPELAGVVGKNIGAIVKIRAEEERKKGLQERIADALTIFSGSMAFVYVHAVWFGFWIAFNVGWFRSAPFDPFPFSLLTLIVSLEAIFLSTFVLISQNRADSIADKRADLDLQINLLSEHEITHLLTMIDAIAAHLGIDARKGMEIEDLKKEVGAEQVLHEIESRRKFEQEKQ